MGPEYSGTVPTSATSPRLTGLATPPPSANTSYLWDLVSDGAISDLLPSCRYGLERWGLTDGIVSATRKARKNNAAT